jgi:adenylylsulfate kinase-like enzyme
MPDVVGLDIPWHAPRNPDLRLDVDSAESPESHADHVILAIPKFEIAMRKEISA